MLTAEDLLYSIHVMAELRVHLRRVVAVLLPATVVVFFILILPYKFQQQLNGLLWMPVAPSPPRPEAVVPEQCDLFRGEWVPDPAQGFPYTNSTCPFMDCVTQADTAEFPRWRWRPASCELPEFDPAAFLEVVRGKSMAFVGDSLARNQMESLLCLLSTVDLSVDLDKVTDSEPHIFFPKHNFYLAYKWSPFLVRAETTPQWTPIGSFNLYLDQPDAKWTTGIESFDYVIISAGRWFMDRPNYFFEEGKLVGCHACGDAGVPEVDPLHAYRRVFRTALAYLSKLPGYRAGTYLRTYSPPHYENGTWNEGGVCPRTRPWRSEELRLEGSEAEGPYYAQVEEFRAVEEVAAAQGLKFRLLDVTGAMLLRPDGHPGRYESREIKDCVHWCMPGPVDVWNIMLFDMLKRELRMVSSIRECRSCD